MFNKDTIPKKEHEEKVQNLETQILELKRLKKIEIEDLERKHSRELELVQQDKADTIKQLTLDNELALKEKEFELTHYKDEELQNLKAENVTISSKLAVAEKEINMLEKLVDVNADIVSVKDIINKLMDKLPSVNISSLAVTTQANKE